MVYGKGVRPHFVRGQTPGFRLNSRCEMMYGKGADPGRQKMEPLISGSIIALEMIDFHS